MNAATAPAEATMMPPIAGPKLRAMLSLMTLSATAEGSASAGTCSLTDTCQAGPNKAIPLPMMKQETSRRAGVMTQSHARAESDNEPASAIDRATSPTIRRSNISAIAPAGTDTSATGSINDVWTNATILVDDEIFVIDQAAPTPRTRSPRLDSRLAVQMRRHTRSEERTVGG